MNNRVPMKLTFLTAFGWFAIAPTMPCHAAPIALATPAGLTPGEHFQLVFVTRLTTEATSSAISTYNNLVNLDAAGAPYDGNTVSWLAIASTPSVSAMAQTGDANIPVYLVNGTEVASSTTQDSGGLWSESILHPINETIYSTLDSDVTVWTGTAQDGVTLYGLGSPNSGFGDVSTAGNTSYDDGVWANWAVITQNDASLPLYGISQVLVVPVAVPEPTSSTLLVVGIVAAMTLVQSRLRRRMVSRGSTRRETLTGKRIPVRRTGGCSIIAPAGVLRAPRSFGRWHHSDRKVLGQAR
jgi:hypothetical protein